MVAKDGTGGSRMAREGVVVGRAIGGEASRIFKGRSGILPQISRSFSKSFMLSRLELDIQSCLFIGVCWEVGW